jgi:GNAT superfamily N-acetyltransferase
MRANEFIIESLKQPHDQGVVEAFDQPYKGKWEKSESDSHDMLVRLPDGTNLSIMFNNEGNDEYQVEFYRNNSQKLTGEGDAQRIFATVLNAIQKFVKKRQPWRLIFSASKSVEPGQNTQSRARLYDRLVGRYANDWGYESYSEDHGDQITYEITKKKQGVAENLDNNGISFKVQKGKNKFATTLSIGGKPVGVYQYNADTGRSIAEVYPEFKGQGLGKLLVLHAIYTAANLGLDFQEDESRTSEYDNVLDSLSSNGYIVDDDGYWYVTSKGEQYLKQSLKQGIAEGLQVGAPNIPV